MNVVSKIDKWMDENKKELIELIIHMVKERSTQGKEANIQYFISKKLKEIHFDVNMWEIGGEELFYHEAFFSSRNSFTGSPNVVGVKKGSGNGRSIVLNGHVDVVPEGEITSWEDDPYSGTFVDGKVYGRGSTDMKGGNAALLFAVKALHHLQLPLKGDIIFHSVVEEESGGAGTLAAILEGYTGDAAIIPEPTNMKIFPKQQGSIWFRLSVKGMKAHGGTRYEGVSAIEKCEIVLASLRELEKIRNERIKDPLYVNIPIPIPINVGVIEGGDWPSSVADLVKIEGRYGISPEETIVDAKREFERWMNHLQDRDSWFRYHPVKVEWFGACWLPGAIELEHPFVQLLIKNYKNVLGTEPTIEASPWGTDGGMLSNVGNTPSVVFGPGVTSLAHFSNEYVEVDKVLQCAKIIAYTVYEWCNVEKN